MGQHTVRPPPILLAISGQTKPYVARRYFKSPQRGVHAIATIEFDTMDDRIPFELEQFRKGIYAAELSMDHIPEGAA